MKNEKFVKFNAFRRRSLKNSRDSLSAAENLLGKKVNHIAYHLALLSIEEIGQIFMYWIQINQEETWGKPNTKIELDDHEKKLFYAFWGPSIGNELITQAQMNDHKSKASKLHQRRLQTLYGVVDDTIECAEKVTDEEVQSLIILAKARLDLANTEGEANEEVEKKDNEFLWFHNYLKDPEKERFVFGKIAQDKLIELHGDGSKWIKWIKALYEKEQQLFNEFATKEINRVPTNIFGEFKPKWEITFTVKTPSHSIRPKALTTINKKFHFPIKFYPGKDNHTLIIKNVLGTNVLVKDLWPVGWLSCQLFVAALNIGSSGTFYWNMVIDVDRFYDSITDLENKQKLLVRLETSLRLNWREKRMYLTEQNLEYAFFIYDYFALIEDKEEGKAIHDYITAIGMLAKTDIHLRLETSILTFFFLAFKSAVVYHQRLKPDDDYAEIGFQQIEKMLKGKHEFDRVIKLAKELEEGNELSEAISLTEAIAMKNYCDIYFMTIAARKSKKDDSLKLVPIQTDKNSSEPGIEL